MDWLIVVAVVIGGIALLVWAARAGRPRSSGSSDADRYQQELARRAETHTKEQVARALALKPVNPAGRTGYSTATAYRSTPAQGQNVTHGQNGPGGGGQNAGYFPGQPQGGPMPISPQLVMQLQGMSRSGQKIAAIKVLRQQTNLSLTDAKNFVDRL